MLDKFHAPLPGMRGAHRRRGRGVPSVCLERAHCFARLEGECTDGDLLWPCDSRACARRPNITACSWGRDEIVLDGIEGLGVRRVSRVNCPWYTRRETIEHTQRSLQFVQEVDPSRRAWSQHYKVTCLLLQVCVHTDICSSLTIHRRFPHQVRCRSSRWSFSVSSRPSTTRSTSSPRSGRSEWDWGVRRAVLEGGKQ